MTRRFALALLASCFALAACSDDTEGGGADASADTDTDTDADTDSDTDSDTDTDTDTDSDTDSDTDTDTDADGGACTPGVAVGNACDANGDVIAVDDCGDQVGGVVEDCLAAASNGACVDGVCGCANGFVGDDCTSCLVHVSPTGSDSNDGSTWALAMATVQAGLDAAAATLAAADAGAESCEVWVQAGAYLPTASGGRNATFALRANVALYGGFGGDEFLRSERDIAAHATILTGDLGAAGDSSDNAYHVVTGATFATIDGFTIAAGNANGTFGENGGGMYNDAASPTVSNCLFVGNSASFYGGGMYNLSASPTVTGCTFSGNSAGYGGGMWNESGSSPVVTGCAFSNNSAEFGGGMYNSGASPTVTGCTFSGNSADYVGGGMRIFDVSSPVVTNCTFFGNSSGEYGGGMANSSSSPTVTNCIFWGDSAVSDGDEFDNESATPTVTYSIVAGGYAGGTSIGTFAPLFADTDTADSDGLDLHLLEGSPAIDAANGCAANDLDGDGQSRFDIAAVPNTGRGPAADLGAYEYQGGAEDTAIPAGMTTACCTIDADGTAAHDYWRCDVAETWAGAEARCALSGMHLVSIADTSENALVLGLLGTSYTYIGASDSAAEGTWTWSDGTTWTWTDTATDLWNAGEPNNSGNEDCAMMIDSSSPSAGLWNDVPCTATYPFVCESAD